MGKPKGTMQEKFNKKKDEEAKLWLNAHGFTPPYYEDARLIESLPSYVRSYFKRHRLKSSSGNDEVESEPNA